MQAAQLQLLNLQQALVVGPIQHVEPLDIEPATQLQLAQCPLGIGGQHQLGTTGKLAVAHADAQQILQIGLGPAERQALLLDLAVEAEGGEGEVAVKVQFRLVVERPAQGERAALPALAAQRAQRQRQGGELAQQRFAAARFGQLELALFDASLLEAPAPGFARRRRFGGFTGVDRRLGDQQGRQIQLLVGIEHRADGRCLERQPVDLQRLLVAVERDAGQRELLEAGKFAALATLELPVIEGQLALG